MKKLTLLLMTLFFILMSASVLSTPPPPPPYHGNGHGPPCSHGAPIGDGLLILTILGVAYGTKIVFYSKLNYMTQRK